MIFLFTWKTICMIESYKHKVGNLCIKVCDLGYKYRFLPKELYDHCCSKWNIFKLSSIISQNLIHNQFSPLHSLRNDLFLHNIFGHHKSWRQLCLQAPKKKSLHQHQCFSHKIICLFVEHNSQTPYHLPSVLSKRLSVISF